MAESKAYANTASGHNTFKEAVCIDAGRIYDSCSDKDCLEDLQVVFAPDAQFVIDAATSAKVKSVEVLTVCLDVEPVPFKAVYKRQIYARRRERQHEMYRSIPARGGVIGPSIS